MGLRRTLSDIASQMGAEKEGVGNAEIDGDWQSCGTLLSTI